MNLVNSDENVHDRLVYSDDDSEDDNVFESFGSKQVAGGANVLNTMNLDNEDENGNFFYNIVIS